MRCKSKSGRARGMNEFLPHSPERARSFMATLRLFDHCARELLASYDNARGTGRKKYTRSKEKHRH